MGEKKTAWTEKIQISPIDICKEKGAPKITR